MSSITSYTPAPPPQNLEGLPVYLHRELLRISAIVSALALVPTYHEEPPSSEEGQFATAAGNWATALGGAGLYFHTGGSWTFVV